MAISNIWTIAGLDNVYHTFSELGLSGLTCAAQTQSSAGVAFTQSTAYDSDPIFAYLEPIKIKRDGVLWWQGICMSPRRTGSGSAESISYTARNPWFQLEQVTFKQLFTRYIGLVPVATYVPRLALGTDASGNRINSGEIISEAVEYAITELDTDAMLQLGTVDVATEIPYDSLTSLTCAEVIQRCLRYNPDVVDSWDFTTTPPTLNLERRANLASQTFAIDDVIIQQNSINPRNDLQKLGVSITYERTDTVGDAEQVVILTDTAGDIASPQQRLDLYFNLDGSTQQIIEQSVVSKTINASSSSWWKAKSVKLQGATGITVTDGEVEAIVNEDEESTDYTKELISGGVAEWMGGVGVWPQAVTAKISYTDKDGVSHTSEKFRLQVQGTNANSATYRTTGAFDAAEPTPTGLAADLLASYSVLHYEGSLTLAQEEVPVGPHLNKTVNISGGRSEWATMEAQVYSVSYDIDNGQTTISFGPAKHLAADDIYQLQRNVRTRKSTNGSVRVSTGGNTRNLSNSYANTIAESDGGGDTGVGIRVIKKDDDTVTVTEGSVGMATLTELTLSASDGDEVWIKATLPSEGAAPTSVSAQIGPPGADTTTSTSRKWATIAVDGEGNLSITPHRAGSYDVDSCGDSHNWIS
ncbi:hypothetical protein ACWPKS_15995 [Coraliomargarita sp. W4R72]